MPYSSSALTSDASEKRGGGSVKCCVGTIPVKLDAVAFLHRRQYVVRVVLHDVVHAFLIDGDVAGRHQGRAVRAQHGALRAVLAREHFHRHGVEDGRGHLAGHGALPDQRIQPELIGLEFLFDVAGQNIRRGRADRFVRFLCVLRLGAEHPRLFRKPRLTVQLHDHIANLSDGLLRQIERVGAHIGDETDLALADVDAFVQLLRDAHGFLRAEAQFAGGLLLQGRGRERRRGIALALLAIHRSAR